MELVVHDRRLVADAIVELDLRHPGGASLPPFEPGCHIDVVTPIGEVRQYSLCNDPTETHRYLLGVLLDRQTRGGSAAVHRLGKGDAVTVSLPRNNFALCSEAPHVVLAAGGIGITPLKAMAHALRRRGMPFDLHYFARSRAHAAFQDQLREAFGARVHFHFDDEGGGLPLPAAQLRPCDGAQLYVCGPAGFIDRVIGDAAEAGYAADAVHVEHFGAAPVQAGGEFVVEAVKSGVQVRVGPSETMADALEKAGVRIMTSCRQGICGTCLTRVIDGTPEHRDDCLSDEERAGNELVAVCCSRSKTPVLRLDI